MCLPKFEERLFLFWSESLVVQDKEDVFPKFIESAFGRLSREFLIKLLPPRGIQQLDPCFTKLARRFLEPGA